MTYNKIQEIIKSETAKSVKQLAIKKNKLASEISTRFLFSMFKRESILA